MSFNKLNAAQARKLIGRLVQWEEGHDKHRGTYIIRTGIIEEVRGKNIRTESNWKWLPDMINLKEKSQ